MRRAAELKSCGAAPSCSPAACRAAVARAHERVWTAANGREALERLSVLAPQLILLDLMMPVMNGLEFLSMLRQHSTLSATPVVVISAWSKEAQSVAAQGFLSKPIDLDALFNMIRRFCAP
ncbi:response regulator [Sorangium sp. So ce1128]